METELLERVILTLDSITLSGKNNLDKMLGCMNALESMIKVAKVQQSKKAEGEEVTENGG